MGDKVERRFDSCIPNFVSAESAADSTMSRRRARRNSEGARWDDDNEVISGGGHTSPAR